jgi:hypothetical protein
MAEQERDEQGRFAGDGGGPDHPKDAGAARERTSKTRAGAKAFAASDVANRTGLPRDN